MTTNSAAIVNPTVDIMTTDSVTSVNAIAESMTTVTQKLRIT